MNNKNITKRRGRMHRRNIPVGGANGNEQEEGEPAGEQEGEPEGEPEGELPPLPLSLARDELDTSVEEYVRRRINAGTPIYYRRRNNNHSINSARQIQALRNAFSDPRFQLRPRQEGEGGGRRRHRTRRTRRTRRKKHASRRKHKSYRKRK